MNARTERRLTVDEFPIELHRRLKSVAAMEGVSMRAAAIEAIIAWCATRELRQRQAAARMAANRDG
jgi:predicted DNA-binding protein (UPF0251 family)